jgi:nitroreductase
MTMNIDELQKLVEQRRSIRGYDESRDVPDETIQMILNCARWAPSGGNGQPWEFLIVRDRATRHKIADYYLK